MLVVIGPANGPDWLIGSGLAKRLVTVGGKTFTQNTAVSIPAAVLRQKKLGFRNYFNTRGNALSMYMRNTAMPAPATMSPMSLSQT